MAATSDTEIICCVVGSYAKNPTTGEGLPELVCFQAEADTAMFAIYSKLRSDGYTAAVVLDTEDTASGICCSADAGHPVLEKQTKTD